MRLPALRYDPEQRFSCRECGRCCRGWDVAVTQAEVDGYRRAGAERLFVDPAQAAGEALDPFEPLGEPGFYRIRKRSDGACGFLSPGNRCRIHEELGAEKKPLTCRMFPFAVHPGGPRAVLTASLSCPTVVENAGARLGDQAALLGGLAREWRGVFPEPQREAALVNGRPLDDATADVLRTALGRILARRRPDGALVLGENVLRMAHLLDDLTRHRVLKLAPAAFAEYLSLTSAYAAASDRAPVPRAASPIARLLGRGLLFATLATQAQVRNPRRQGLRIGPRLRLAHLLGHVHGLAPAPAGLDLRAARAVMVDIDGPGLQPLVAKALRNVVESLGTGRHPVLDELALGLGILRVALVLAAMRAGQAGRAEVDRGDFVEGLVTAADLSHAEGGALGGFLRSLAGGVEGLYLFADLAGRKRVA